MSLYTFITGLTALTFFLTGLYVYVQNIHRLLYKRCFIFSTSVALWAFGYFITVLEAPSYQLNIIASRLSHAFGAFIPITYLHFVWAILRRQSRKRLFFWSYLFSAFMFLMCLTPLVVKELLPKMGIKYYPEWGMLYPVYSSLFLAFPGYAQYEMALEIMRTKGAERTRLIYFFVALALAFSGGVSLFLLIFNVQFPPYLSVLIILYPPMMAYTILVYRFMDIEVIIKRTLVFAGVFGVMMAVVGVVSALAQSYVGQFLKMGPRMSMALSVMVAILLYDPTRRFMVNVTDRYLFQKKQGFKEILNRLSTEIIAILDIAEVGKTILTTLKDTLRLVAGAILIKDESEKNYLILDAFGINGKRLRFDREDPFIRYLSESQGMVNLESSGVKSALAEEVRDVLEGFNAVIALPLFFQKDLIGALFLGKKKSDQGFTQEDMDYFPTVASQVALALRNARLHDIIMKSQIDFAQQAKMAAIGTLAAGIGHEVKNPLNNIKAAIGMLKLNRRHNLFKDKTMEEIWTELFETLEIIEKNVDRATRIIDRLQSFAKKPKELKVEKVNLEEALESAITFVSNQFEIQAITIVRNYSADFPYVSADRGALEDAMLNLITNAAQAMKGEGTMTLTIADKSSEVQVSIQDTGAGIAPENLDKIFDPFFTTKDTTRNSDSKSVKGTGLGLFIVREIIKRFGGRIVVESEVDRGTVFHIIFPVYRETQSAA